MVSWGLKRVRTFRPGSCTWDIANMLRSMLAAVVSPRLVMVASPTLPSLLILYRSRSLYLVCFLLCSPWRAAVDCELGDGFSKDRIITGVVCYMAFCRSRGVFSLPDGAIFRSLGANCDMFKFKLSGTNTWCPAASLLEAADRSSRFRACKFAFDSA